MEQGGDTLLRKRFPGCLLVTQRVWGSVEASSYSTWVPSGVRFTSVRLLRIQGLRDKMLCEPQRPVS